MNRVPFSISRALSKMVVGAILVFRFSEKSFTIGGGVCEEGNVGKTKTNMEPPNSAYRSVCAAAWQVLLPKARLATLRTSTKTFLPKTVI